MIQWYCRQCNEVLEASERRMGEQIECGKCGSTSIVPGKAAIDAIEDVLHDQLVDRNDYLHDPTYWPEEALESLASTIYAILMWGGLLSLIGLAISLSAVFNESSSYLEFCFYFSILSAVSFINANLWYALLVGAAEVIRILKLQNGISYRGNIAGLRSASQRNSEQSNR